MSNIRDRILSQKDYTVVGVGDSHMWGQGAEGSADAFSPEIMFDLLKRLPKEIPSFLSLFEMYISRARNGIGTTEVINSGYGSTSTTKYLDSYWNDKVIGFKPDLVILEFAINDWLEYNKVSLEEYKNNLRRMSSQVIASGGNVILLTVSPIRGNQFNGANYYGDYISASREVAYSDSRIQLADANLKMNKFLDSCYMGEKESLLYSDDWHVAQKGQELYFESILDVIGIL